MRTNMRTCRRDLSRGRGLVRTRSKRQTQIINYRIADCLMRKAEISRDTYETKIQVAVNLDGTGRHDLNSGVPFLDHRSEEHTSELQSRFDLVCRLLLEKKK